MSRGILSAFAQSTWHEWICLGRPFGILGLKKSGGVSWLQLELRNQLNEAAEVAAANGASRDWQESIAGGYSVCDVELCCELGQPAEHAALPSIQPCGETPTWRTARCALRPLAVTPVTPLLRAGVRQVALACRCGRQR